MTTRDNYSSGIYLSECDIAQDISLSWLYFLENFTIIEVLGYDNKR